MSVVYTPTPSPSAGGPPSSEFQVPGQSEAAPDPRKGDGQVPAPHAAPKHTHRHVHTRPRTHTRAPAHTHAPPHTRTCPRTHARTHTHTRTHARTHASLSSVPAREVWLKLSCPPWCLQSSCQHPPADSPSPACEANAGTMNSPAQRGGRRSLQGAEVEAQACGRCGRRGCCSRCGRMASVAGMAGQARGPRASISSLTTRGKAPTALAPRGTCLRQCTGSHAHPRGCFSSFLDESVMEETSRMLGREAEASYSLESSGIPFPGSLHVLPSQRGLCLALSAVGAWR